MQKPDCNHDFVVRGTNATDNMNSACAYDSEFLKFYYARHTMDMADELEEFRMMKRQEILKNHKYGIWVNEKEGYWYTHLPDDTKKNHRRTIKRKTKKKLESAICEFYGTQEMKNDITVEKLYLEWLPYKELHTRRSTTMRRISADWKRFYENDPISQVKLRNLTELYLDEWVHRVVKENHLEKKQYYNMVTIIKNILPYAVKKGYISVNPFENVKMESRLLVAPKRKDDKTQVFLVDEIPHIFQELDRHFTRYSKNTAPLAVELAFLTGLRVGELVAIRYEDIQNDYLHICRQEVKEFTRKDINGEYKLSGFMIVNHTKSDAGDRYVFLTREARKIIERIKVANMENGEPTDGYLFVKNGERIKTRAAVYQLDRCLNALSMEHRSIHKARKTYVSALIDGGININEIKRQVGHSDIQTTYANYCFNRYGEEETNRKIEMALYSGEACTISQNGKNSHVTKRDQKIITFPA